MYSEALPPKREIEQRALRCGCRWRIGCRSGAMAAEVRSAVLSGVVAISDASSTCSVCDHWFKFKARNQGHTRESVTASTFHLPARACGTSPVRRRYKGK